MSLSSDEVELLILCLNRSLNQLELYDQVQRGFDSFSDMGHYRNWLKEILDSTVQDLKRSGATEPLNNCLEKLKEGQEIESLDRLRLDDLQRDVRQMEEELKSMVARKTQNIQDLNVQVGQIKDQLDREVNLTCHKMNVCSQYERQLLEDCRQQIANECLHWETEAVNLEEKIEQEGKRSADVEIQLCAQIESLQGQLAELHHRYERDIGLLDEEIAIRQAEHDQHKAGFDQVYAVYADRQRVIEEDTANQRAIEEHRKSFAKRQFVIIRIQRWWRQTLALRRAAEQEKELANRKKRRTSGRNHPGRKISGSSTTSKK